MLYLIKVKNSKIFKIYFLISFSKHFDTKQKHLIITGPSSAFEKWSGHETSKTFHECRRHEWGASTSGGHPPSRNGGSGDRPRDNFIFLDVLRNDLNAL